MEGKWTRLFLSREERALLTGLATQARVKRFKELASVDVGIVTGANDFFLVPDRVVSQFQLERWAHPMFGRSEHVRGLVYSPADHLANKQAGLPANFIWFREGRLDDLPAHAQRYLELGLARNLPTRYKCRVREPWFKVPSVYAAPVAMLKRAHHYPRLVLNSARAYSTDTAYRIRPDSPTSPEGLVLSFINSLTCLTAELEGRHYGGGVLELVPSEIERLLVPDIQADLGRLELADQGFRKSQDQVAFLRQHDRLVLGEIGIVKSDQELLFQAWLKLRDRRQRTPSVEQP